MAVVAYLNGEFLDPEHALIPIDERGHQFGDGVYEVVRVYAGRPFLLDWHLERLERSLAAIGIENPHSRDEWVSLIHEAIRRSGEAEALVYWQVTRGIAVRAHLFPVSNPSVSLTVRPFTAEAAVDPWLLLMPDERWANPWVKTLNLLPNVIAKEVAHRQGAVEALLVRSGQITEGSSSNAWFVRGGELWTHPANRYILNGITRRFVLALAEELGIPVHEEALSWRDLRDVEEVFMTSTAVEVEPIRRIAVAEALEPALDGWPADAPASLLPSLGALRTVWSQTGATPVTDRLRQAFSERVARFRNQQPVLR
jgi:D-alanine transaminase